MMFNAGCVWLLYKHGWKVKAPFAEAMDCTTDVFDWLENHSDPKDFLHCVSEAFTRDEWVSLEIRV